MPFSGTISAEPTDRPSLSALHLEQLFARLAIGSAFLSSVADRFGFWGPPGGANASWGDFRHFMNYAARVESFLPPGLQLPAAAVATVAEIICGIGIFLPGRLTRYFACASGVLLLTFAGAMALTTGIKSVLNYSVLTAAGAAFLLARSEYESGR